MGGLSSLRNLGYSPRQPELTVRQFIVLQLLACGLADKEIAHVIGVRVATVKHHTSRLIRTFGLHRRPQLVRFVFENQFFDPEVAERLLLAPQSRRRTYERAPIMTYLGVNPSFPLPNEERGPSADETWHAAT